MSQPTENEDPRVVAPKQFAEEGKAGSHQTPKTGRMRDATDDAAGSHDDSDVDDPQGGSETSGGQSNKDKSPSHNQRPGSGSGKSAGESQRHEDRPSGGSSKSLSREQKR
jgi:hypothetical protein